MDMRLRRETVGGLALLTVSGDLDLATLPQLHSQLLLLIGGNPGSVVAVDLDGVVTMDDTGFGVLLGAAGRARDLGGDLIIVCSDPRLSARLALTRLDRAVDVVTSVHDIASARD